MAENEKDKIGRAFINRRFWLGGHICQDLLLCG